MASSQTIINHDEIRAWVEKRGGRPAVATRTKDGNSAMLRINFGEPEDALQEISWEDFFRIFEERNLAFLYQDETADGKESRFFKLVDRSTV